MPALVRNFLHITLEPCAVAVRQYSIRPDVRATTVQNLTKELGDEVFDSLVSWWDDYNQNWRTRPAHCFSPGYSAGGIAEKIRNSIFPLFDWVGTKTFGEALNLELLDLTSKGVRNHYESVTFSGTRQYAPSRLDCPKAIAELEKRNKAVAANQPGCGGSLLLG
jgi:hypothetical protein